MSGIVDMGGVRLAAAIREGEVSCVEAAGAFLDRIDAVNPAVNAIVALRDRASILAEAARKDEERRAGATGPLHGLPIAVKDLAAVKGMPFVQGSAIFRDTIAETDAVFVERLREAGAIIIGKTNTPEFGLGSHTYNAVYGATKNAYDQTRSAGGSSGGAAVALATRMLPIADGSDYGGSLRNPAGWNNIYSLRPSIGRVPPDVKDGWLPSMSTLGPMGRTVEDLSLLLAVMAGFDPRAPLSLDAAELAPTPGADMRGRRIGWLGDFGGFVPFEAGVLDLCRETLRTFETLGCAVEEARVDYAPQAAWEAQLTLRAWQAGGNLLAHYQDPAKRALMKPEAVFEVESGLKLSAYDVTHASVVRTEWTKAFNALFKRYDYLVAPSAQVFPFPIEEAWPRTVGNRAMTTYHEWMTVCFLVTLTGSPVLTAPAGFSEAGVPMGLQLIGPNRGERSLLELGAAYEAATRWVERRPPALRP